MMTSESNTSFAEFQSAVYTRLITGSPAATENDSPKSSVTTDVVRSVSCVATESRRPSDSVTSINRSGDAVPPAILRAGIAGRDVRDQRHDDEQDRQRDRAPTAGAER